MIVILLLTALTTGLANTCTSTKSLFQESGCCNDSSSSINETTYCAGGSRALVSSNDYFGCHFYDVWNMTTLRGLYGNPNMNIAELYNFVSELHSPYGAVERTSVTVRMLDAYYVEGHLLVECECYDVFYTAQDFLDTYRLKRFLDTGGAINSFGLQVANPSEGFFALYGNYGSLNAFSYLQVLAPHPDVASNPETLDEALALCANMTAGFVGTVEYLRPLHNQILGQLSDVSLLFDGVTQVGSFDPTTTGALSSYECPHDEFASYSVSGQVWPHFPPHGTARRVQPPSYGTWFLFEPSGEQFQGGVAAQIGFQLDIVQLEPETLLNGTVVYTFRCIATGYLHNVNTTALSMTTTVGTGATSTIRVTDTSKVHQWYKLLPELYTSIDPFKTWDMVNPTVAKTKGISKDGTPSGDAFAVVYCDQYITNTTALIPNGPAFPLSFADQSASGYAVNMMCCGLAAAGTISDDGCKCFMSFGTLPVGASYGGSAMQVDTFYPVYALDGSAGVVRKELEVMPTATRQLPAPKVGGCGSMYCVETFVLSSPAMATQLANDFNANAALDLTTPVIDFTLYVRNDTVVCNRRFRDESNATIDYLDQDTNTTLILAAMSAYGVTYKRQDVYLSSEESRLRLVDRVGAKFAAYYGGTWDGWNVYVRPSGSQTTGLESGC